MAIPKIDLSDFIEKWKSAKRGKEVRQASADAFEQIQRIVNEALQKCYDEATGNPESILAHTGNTKNPHETKAANLPVTDTYGAAGTAGNTVFMQALADALADKIVNQVLTKGELINNALATEAGVAALDAAMGKTLQDQITQQNSNLQTTNNNLQSVKDNMTHPSRMFRWNEVIVPIGELKENGGEVFNKTYIIPESYFENGKWTTAAITGFILSGTGYTNCSVTGCRVMGNEIIYSVKNIGLTGLKNIELKVFIMFVLL